MAESQTTATVVNRAGPNAVESFWTKQKIEEATAEPFYDEASDSKAVPSYLPGAPEDIGRPGSTNSGRPEARDLLGEDDAREGAGAPVEAFGDPHATFGEDFGTKDEYDSFPAYKEVWSRTVFPWRAIGKLFFTKASGASSYCSASVIGRNNAIVTAAHCCYDRGTKKWNKNFAFAPGKDNTSEPYGRFSYVAATILTSWITTGGRQNDVCVITTRSGLSSKTGWLGRSWNQPQTEHVFTFGYPSAKDGGNRQNVCASENMKNCYTSTTVNATGCDKMNGDSGAPWIRIYRPRETGAKNYVNSVTSGWDSCTGIKGKTYNGARFTSNNIVPLCNTRKCDL